MGLKGKGKPKQLLAPATADAGAGEMTAEPPTWLLAGLRRAVGVCRSTWTYIWGWGRLCGEKQPAPALAGGTARLADGRKEWVCGAMKDLNTEGQVLSQGKCGLPRIH